MTTLGQTRGRPPHKQFGILQADRLFHCAMFGMTGTGKSTLLKTMMRQDWQHNTGFCLIEPHGDLSKAMAEKLGDDCLYWDVADPNNKIGYNPLTFVRTEYRPLVASGLIDTLKKQWSDAWGARMEHLLRYVLLALLERPQSTLMDVIPMFLNKGFRQQVLAGVNDPMVKRFWEIEYKAMNFKNAADAVPPISNKLGAFLAHPLVRQSMCYPKTPIRFREIMDEGKILIVNLAKGKLGADVANLMGGLVFSNITHAAYSRESIPLADRRPFFIYADEIHAYTTEAIADILSELRKYAVGLVAASQFTGQLSSNVLDAIFGNVGTLIAFRLGANDAALIAKQFGADVPSPRDFVSLSNYEMFIKQMNCGRQCKVFSARTQDLALRPCNDSKCIIEA
ncbi:MAG: DUF87 domain-containing protein, partial [Pseudomonadota bacterium]